MQTKKRKQNHVIVAFPGMGKTTYALSHSGTIDLDFGNFRSALSVKKEEQHTIYAPFSRLVKFYYHDGYDVLINDPGLIPLVKQFAEGHIIVALPSNEQDLVERVKLRAQGDNYHSQDFAKMMEANVHQWVQDWERVAVRYKCKIQFVDGYLQEVMI